MKKILFATKNESKVKRFKEGLLKNNIEIITINDIKEDIDINENGKNAIENALIKARAYANIYDFPVFAMDDNLYIEDIPEDKQPGMYVRWVYGIAVICNGVEKTYTWSKEDFYIVDKPSDKINPGYPLNTISINKKLNKYFVDITEEEKQDLNENESEVIEFICKNV